MKKKAESNADNAITSLSSTIESQRLLLDALLLLNEEPETVEPLSKCHNEHRSNVCRLWEAFSSRLL